MTQFHPRAAAPRSLASLRYELTLRATIDEIAALRLHQPSTADYAAFISNPASVADIVERARIHADQVARFIALAQDTPSSLVTPHIPQLYALVLLNTTATVAVAIMPARDGGDRHARRQQGMAFLQTLENPDENELRFLGEIAFGLKELDAQSITQDAIAFAGRGHGETPTPSRATVHRIEENATLGHWLKRRTHVSVLLAEAHHHAAMADRLRASLDHDELSPRDRDEIAAACEGALLQHVLALADLALSPGAVDTDLIFDAAHSAVTDCKPLHAAVLIAIAVGQHYRAMMAAHPV